MAGANAVHAGAPQRGAAHESTAVQQAVWPQGPAVVAPWHGHYVGGIDESTGRTDLKLSASGEFILRYATAFVGCTNRSGTSLGKAAMDGEAIAFSGRLMETFTWYPYAYEQRRCLIKDEELLALVNDINARGEATVPGLACTGGAEGTPPGKYRFTAASPLPARYRGMLLRSPLTASVSGARDRTTVPGNYFIETKDGIKELLWHTARLEIDQGSKAGLFIGMRLYAGTTPAIIEELADDRAVASVRWSSHGTTTQWEGTALTSRAPADDNASTSGSDH